MVCAPSILSLFILAITPLLYFLKPVPEVLKKVNTGFQMLFYAPVAFFSTLSFALLQVYYLPFAYYYTIINKRKLADWSSKNTHKLPDTRNGRSHWMFFMAFGLPKMMFRCVTDTLNFFVHLFVHVGEEAVAEGDQIKYLSLSDFEIVEGIIEQFFKEREFKTPFRNLVKRL